VEREAFDEPAAVVMAKVLRDITYRDTIPRVACAM
jgi:hypothetical protein